MNMSLFVVDSRIANIDQLLRGVTPSARIVRVMPQERGIEQVSMAIAQARQNGHEVEQLEIISHGQPGELQLGRDRLNYQQLQKFQGELATWGQALGNAGEIILHGCRVGANQIGQAFVEQLHRLTGVAIAANRDLTGGDRTEGNWEFDVLVGGATGRSGLSWDARHTYGHTLMDPILVNVPNDNGLGDTGGTLSYAIREANETAGPDTILLQTGVTLTRVMTRLINSDITITGDDPSTPAIESQTIRGGSEGGERGFFRPLFIRSGTVTLQDLTIANGLATGGDGGAGGAGAGLGGGLFVYDGNVTIQRVNFNDNAAIGGHIIPLPNAGGGACLGMGAIAAEAVYSTQVVREWVAIVLEPPLENLPLENLPLENPPLETPALVPTVVLAEVAVQMAGMGALEAAAVLGQAIGRPVGPRRVAMGALGGAVAMAMAIHLPRSLVPAEMVALGEAAALALTVMVVMVAMAVGVVPVLILLVCPLLAAPQAVAVLGVRPAMAPVVASELDLGARFLFDLAPSPLTLSPSATIQLPPVLFSLR